MTRRICWLMALLVVGPAWADPAGAVSAACADCRLLPADKAYRTRYLDLSSVPEARRETLRLALSFWCNSLSREADIVRPRDVTPTLLAIDIADYGWDRGVYGFLGEPSVAEPYFHVVLQSGKEKATAAAPWLPTLDAAELATRTQSRVAVIRGDWFVYNTAVQAARDGHGYYDFLGLGKKESDFQRLVGADPALARQLKKEQAAAVAVSAVTLNNRAIHRFQAVTGPYWFTTDYKTSKDRQNTVRLLDFTSEPPKGDASEQYGTLPNGLFAFFLCNANGDRVDSAPDFIASDGRSTSTDRRVHVGLSCVRCHTPGIQDVDDHARRLFRGSTALASPDYEKLKRLRQLYLSDLPRQVRRDQQDYAEAVRACNGLTPAANARALADVWAWYEEPVYPVDAARELAVPVEVLLEALRRSAYAGDPALASFLATPPVPMRREHWEEVQVFVHTALGAVR